MTRSGFSAVELMIVIILIGLIAAVGFPKIHGVLDKTNVRSARVAGGAYVVTARPLAVQRGCRAAGPLAHRASSRGPESTPLNSTHSPKSYGRFCSLTKQ